MVDDTATATPQTFQKLLRFLHDDIIGADACVATPFGKRRIIYADFTASGRPLKCIEDYITKDVLTHYGNVHSLSTSTARQSSYYRNEAREVIRNYFGGSHDDAVIFVGDGATAAVNKFIDIQDRSGWLADYVKDRRVISEGRWETYRCHACNVTTIKDESSLKRHLYSESHLAKVNEMKEAEVEPTRRILLFLLDPTLHHSSFLPFKELRDRQEGNTSYRFIHEFIGNDSSTGHCSYTHLINLLKTAQATKDRLISEHSGTFFQTYCVLSACSNVTGIKAPIAELNKLIHSYGAFALWDLASAAGCMKVAMSPANADIDGDCSVDAGFISPHKLLGGPSTPGLLLVKKRMMLNAIPSLPGGGVVHFVSKQRQVYYTRKEEREEAGTPDIISCIRAGLVFRIASLIPHSLTNARELEFVNYMCAAWEGVGAIQLLGPVTVPVLWNSTEKEMPALEKIAETTLTTRKAVVSFLIKYGNGLKKDASALQDAVTDETARSGLVLKRYRNRRTCKGLYLHHNFVCAVLNDVFGIQARPGCACAGPLAHEVLGFDGKLVEDFADCLERTGAEVLRPGFTRISLHYTMSWDEVEVIAAAVKWVAIAGWKLLPFYTFDTYTGEWTQNLMKPSKFRSWFSNLKLRETSQGDTVLSHLDELAQSGQKLSDTQKQPKRDPRNIVGAVALPGMGGSALSELKMAIAQGKGGLRKQGTLKKQMEEVKPPLKGAQGPSSSAGKAAKSSVKERIVSDGPFGSTLTNAASDVSSDCLTRPKTEDACPSTEEENSSIWDPDLIRVATRDDGAVPHELGEYYAAANRLLDAISEVTDKQSTAFERRLANLQKYGLTPPLPGDYSHLLWFAIPADAVKSLGLYSKAVVKDPVPQLLLKPDELGYPIWWWLGRKTVAAMRPTDSPFEARLYPNMVVPTWEGVRHVVLPEKPPLFVNSALRPWNEWTSASDETSKIADRPVPRPSQANQPQQKVSIDVAGEVVSQQSFQRNIMTASTRENAFQPLLTKQTSMAIPSESDMVGEDAAADAGDENEEELIESSSGKLLIPRGLRRSVGRAIQTFEMIKEGDKILVALSGGKDSLSMLHILKDIQQRAPIHFDIAAATVDPQTPEYDPSPLKHYLESLRIPYHVLSYPIVELAKEKLRKASLCSFCARMKRGLLYSCARTHGYDVLALGQHLDDIAESFLMSAFYNGVLNTMKAHYLNAEGEIRIIRPLIFARERDLAVFASRNRLPVITDNCPACFAAPTERLRMKHLLAEQEYEFPTTMSSLSKALMPLMSIDSTDKNAQREGATVVHDDECADAVCSRAWNGE